MNRPSLALLPAATTAQTDTHTHARPVRTRRAAAGFTLIELLVVVAIIGLLVGILLPALSSGRDRARATVNLGNLKQIGVGVALYIQDAKGFFFPHEGNLLSTGQIVDYKPVGSELAAMPYFGDRANLQAAELAGTLAEPAITTANIDAKFRRTHWADYVYPYAPEPKAYTSPMVDYEELRRLNLNLVAEGVYGKYKWGGYGYNQSYLGYEATVDSVTGVVTEPAWAAKLDAQVASPANTVVVCDSAGYRNGSGPGTPPSLNSYAIDPPLYSQNLGKKLGKWYKGSAVQADAELASLPVGSYDWSWRIFPAPRNAGQPGFIFADGHAAAKSLKQMDDLNGDGVFDNGYWTGLGDANPALR